jgi:ribosome biogenesis GTPase / thiamine phosphate phosphatase
MQATVYKSTGSWYVVKNEAGEFINARLKGQFKIEGITSTNPIAVGDKVTIIREQTEAQDAVIIAIAPRENYVARQSPHNKWQHHIIAANLTQSLLFCTLKDPKTSSGFIDRFLVSSEAFHIPTIIVFNKIDLLKGKDLAKLEMLTELYQSIGYTVIHTSVKNNLGLEKVGAVLQNQISLLSGHSGVGKSSLINELFSHLDLATQEVSEWSGKGLHTTTFAEMFDLPNGGALIDTPGIRELGIVQIEKDELAQYFVEMKQLLPQCQFNNCVHINEPQCAVKAAVDKGLIPMERYVNYLTILETMNPPQYGSKK